MKNISLLSFALLCFGLFQFSSSVQAQLVINELMASNDSIVADEFGEYDDWLEIYNMGNEVVNLSGYYLSDKFVELDKWSFPPGILIPANGYLTVWIDKDEEQGNLHTPFKLSGGGEQIILSSPALEIIDSTGFGAQLTDISYARVPNGTGDFVFHTPTYGANNDGGEVLDTFIMAIRHIDIQNINIFPNPVEDFLFVEFEEITDFPQAKLKILNLEGKTILEQKINSPKEQVLLENHPTGLYLLSIEENGQVLYSQKILLK